MARSSIAERAVPYYPAFLDLFQKRVLVVGAGVIASDKVEGLTPCGPDPLIVVAPRASTLVQDAAREERLEWRQRHYRPDDIEGAYVVFAATDDRQVNARVADDARRASIPVLAVDDVPHCDFIAPALVRRGAVTVALSTGGRSPAFARRARRELENLIPAHWGTLLEVAASVREELGPRRKALSPDTWQDSLDGEVDLLVQAGDLTQARALLLSRLLADLPVEKPIVQSVTTPSAQAMGVPSRG